VGDADATDKTWLANFVVALAGGAATLAAFQIFRRRRYFGVILVTFADRF